MTLIKSVKGRLPMNSGAYSSSKVYGKKYRCNLYGCEWESLIEGNNYAPATLVNGTVTPDTVHWRLVSGVPGNYGLDAKVAANRTEIEQIKGGSTDSIASLKKDIAKQNERIDEQDKHIDDKINEGIADLASIPDNEIIVVDSLPDTGKANTVYRVPGEHSYAEWAYRNNAWVKLAEYNNGIDDEPTAGSENLVTSGGVNKEIASIKIDSFEDGYTSNKISFSNSESKRRKIELCKGVSYIFSFVGTKNVAVGLFFKDGDNEQINGGSGISPNTNIEFIPANDVIEISIYSTGEQDLQFNIRKKESIYNFKDLQIKHNKTSKILDKYNLDYIAGFVQGEIGSEISISSQPVWPYHIILPIEDWNVIEFHAFASSLGNYVYYLDEDDIIQRKDLIREKGNYIGYTQNYAKVIININREYANEEDDLFIKLSRHNFNSIDCEKLPVIVSNGNIINSSVNHTIKVPVFGNKYIFADIVAYSGNNPLPQTFNFFDKDLNFISSTGITNHDRVSGFVSAEVPDGAYWALVCNRNKNSNGCDAVIYTEFSVENEINKEDDFYRLSEKLVERKSKIAATGEIGGKVSEVMSAANYAIIPWMEGYDVFMYNQAYNIGGGVMQVDSNGNITSIKEGKNWNYPCYYAIKKDANATHVVYNYINNNFEASFAKIKEIYATSSDVLEGFLISTTGIKSPALPQKNYKIDVSNVRYIFADIEEKSGVENVTFAFYDYKDNFIGYGNKQVASDGIKGLVYAKVPKNASYVSIQARLFLSDDSTRGDDELHLPHFYVLYNDNIEEVLLSEQVLKYNYKKNIPYEGERINLKGFNLTTFGHGVINAPIQVDGVEHSGQGFSIYGKYLFRGYDRGYIEVFDISNLGSVCKVGAFKLGSYINNTTITYNHINCASFGLELNDSGFPYFYDGAMKNKIFVEKITTNSAELVQTIKINTIASNLDRHTAQGVIGDDGYLWIVCSAIVGQGQQNYNKRYFYKFNIPDISISEVVLTDEDALDSWEEDGYNFYVSQAQGMCVKNGYLFWVSGAAKFHDNDNPNMPRKREIIVWDVNTHKQTSVVPLTNIIPHEPEDLEVYNGKLIVCTNYCNFAYALDFN